MKCVPGHHQYGNEVLELNMVPHNQTTLHICTTAILRYIHVF